MQSADAQPLGCPDPALPPEFHRQFVCLRCFSVRDLLNGQSAHKAPILPNDSLPTNLDCREHGAVRPVNDQLWACAGSGGPLARRGCWRVRTSSPPVSLRCSASSRWSLTATMRYTQKAAPHRNAPINQAVNSSDLTGKARIKIKAEGSRSRL